MLQRMDSLTTGLDLLSSLRSNGRLLRTPPTAECKLHISLTMTVTKFFVSRNYIDQATALSKNLTYASGDSFILKADDTTVLSSSGPGRDSVRIQSNKAYTTHVSVYVVSPAISRPSSYTTIFLASISVTCLRDAGLGLLLGRPVHPIGPTAAKLTS